MKTAYELRISAWSSDVCTSDLRVERIIARVEVGDQGADTRFVVTNLKKGSPRWLYEQVYCRRGQAENHIKSWKTHLAADRTSTIGRAQCRASECPFV